MSGPAIQSMVSFSPAAPVSAAPRPEAALPAQPDAAPLAPPPGIPVELEFSELGRILEKLAQMAGAEAKELGQLAELFRGQGKVPNILQMINLAQRAETGNAPAMTDNLRDLIRQFIQAGVTEEGAATPPAAELPAFQGKITQSLQTFAAALKASLTPLLERPPGLAPPAKAGEAAFEPAGSISQAIPSQVEQTVGVVRQFAARLPALLRPGGQTGSPNATLTTALAGPEVNPTGASDAEATETGRLTAALIQLQRSGKPGESPLVRREYIKATLGLVSALLGDPEKTPAGVRPAGRGAAPIAPATTAGAAAGERVQPPQADPIKGLIRELRNVGNLMTVPSGKAWVKIEKTLGSLSQAAAPPPSGNPTAGTIPPERLGELARRGVLFELEFKADPKLEETAVALRRLGVKAEVAQKGESTDTRLRIAVPGRDPQAAPVRLDPPGAPEAARPAPVAAHGRRGDQGAPATQGGPEAAPLPRGEAARAGFAAMVLGGEDNRDEPLPAAPRDPTTSPFRPDQYTHPEAFRLPAHATPKAVAELTAFFQAHREQAILGQEFEDCTAEALSCAPGRAPITDPRRLLEHKPIEVIRPEKTGADAPKDQKPPRFAFEQTRKDPVEKIIDIKPMAARKR